MSFIGFAIGLTAFTASLAGTLVGLLLIDRYWNHKEK